MEKEKLIRMFIQRIKDYYKDNIIIDYEYDATEDEYNIWHNNKHLQFDNPQFLQFVGNLTLELFYKNDFYNFSFGYDYFRAKGNEPVYTVEETTYTDLIPNVEIHHNAVETMYNFYCQNRFEKRVQNFALNIDHIVPQCVSNSSDSESNKYYAGFSLSNLDNLVLVYSEDTHEEERLAA